MNAFQITLDMTMCFLWALTYTLVLIGTVKYHAPLISPITQAIIFPFEFSFWLSLGPGLNYAFLAYTYWIIIELVILFVNIKLGFIKKAYLPLLPFCAALICLMCYLVTYKGHVLFFSYLNTFVGELFWLQFVTKKDYPAKPISLMLFTSKLLADIIAATVYLGQGSWFVHLLCISLPILDLGFISVYFERSKRGRSSSGDLPHARRSG